MRELGSTKRDWERARSVADHAIVALDKAGQSGSGRLRYCRDLRAQLEEKRAKLASLETDGIASLGLVRDIEDLEKQLRCQLGAKLRYRMRGELNAVAQKPIAGPESNGESAGMVAANSIAGGC